MARTTTADVDVKEGTTIVRRPAHKFHDYMLSRADTETSEQTGEEITASQMEKILEAESEESIWAADGGGTVQGRDAVGLELTIRSMRPVRSTRTDIEGGPGYYITCDASCIGGPEDVLRKLGLSPGEDFVFQTGAPLIVTKVRAFEARELLPVNAIIKGTETRSGQTVLRIAPAPKRATPGTAS